MGQPALFGLAAALLKMSTIIDSSGTLISGALVKITQTVTGQERQTVTASDGSYVLPNLPIGPHKLEVNARPFRRYVPSGIVVQVGDNALIYVTMELGSASQQVQVFADPATRDTSISELVDQHRIVDLPLSGRPATDLVLLSGSASVPAGATGRFITTLDYTSVATVLISGGQESGNDYLLDGGDHDDGHSGVNLPFPFPDALQEFNIQTNGVSDAAVNAVTRHTAVPRRPPECEWRLDNKASGESYVETDCARASIVEPGCDQRLRAGGGTNCRVHS
jgi:hypothetical protein